MSANTIPRDYVVTVRLQRIRHAASADDPIERIEVTAYDLNEAMLQGLIMLDAKIGGIQDHGFEAKVVNIEPNCAKAFEQTTSLLRDIALILNPTQGKTS